MIASVWDLMRRLGPIARARFSDSSGASAMLFGLRLAASVCLALLIAFWLQLDNPYWAGTSAGIVAQPALGASLRKGRFRAIGTV
ncbi:MAG TPA: FUSC family protein, partial [Steroidobacteraceae bacterium]|nr:FUSC family protein [Steroidobacteraceae bacterium]